MIDVELDEEMEMPCLYRCGEWFELNDGHSSEKHRNEVICPTCHEGERSKIELEEKIEDLNNQISDAEITIRNAKARLKELGVNNSNKNCKHGMVWMDCDEEYDQCSECPNYKKEVK